MTISLIEKLKSFLNKFKINKKQIFIVGSIAFASIVVFKQIIKIIRRSIRERKKKEEAQIIRRLRDNKIEIFLQNNEKLISQDKILQIIQWDATTLLNKIRQKEVTVIEVFLAYSIRAAKYGRTYGWICDVDFDNGLEQARAYQKLIDEKQFEKIAELPLFGLPISIKDQMCIKGLSTTGGFTSLGYNISQNDSLIVKIIRQKGAIPFLHSNVPQGYLSFDSSNFLWGECRNPWNPTKVAGGSSGGEGGLIGARCSPLGIGSDIGGSIRCPSVFNGLYGFKPTGVRISKQGGMTVTGTSFVGFSVFTSSYGPMCRSIDDVILMAKTLFGSFTEDVHCNNKPFDDNLFGRKIDNSKNKIKIGYITDTKFIDSSPAIREAVLDVKNNLLKLGYDLVEFPINNFSELVQTGLDLLLNSEAIPWIEKLLDGEKVASYYKDFVLFMHLPRFAVILISLIFKLKGEIRSYNITYNSKQMSKFDFIEKCKRFAELKYEFISYFKNQKFEAIISPVLPTVSISIGTAQHYSSFNHFNFLFNMIDMPSCTVPLKLNDSITKYSSSVNDRYSKLLAHEVDTSIGMPLGIQIGALPMQDEWVLRLAKEVSRFYNFEHKEGGKVVEIIEKNLQNY